MPCAAVSQPTALSHACAPSHALFATPLTSQEYDSVNPTLKDVLEAAASAHDEFCRASAEPPEVPTGPDAAQEGCMDRELDEGEAAEVDARYISLIGSGGEMLRASQSVRVVGSRRPSDGEIMTVPATPVGTSAPSRCGSVDSMIDPHGSTPTLGELSQQFPSLARRGPLIGATM